MTDNQKNALNSLLAGPTHLSVGAFTPLRNKGFVKKVDGGPSGGRGMVYCQITSAGRAAIE
jgi:hypothetical protein